MEHKKLRKEWDRSRHACDDHKSALENKYPFSLSFHALQQKYYIIK